MPFLHAPRRINALLLPDLHSDCWPVSAKRAITDDTQSANHRALFLLPLLSGTQRFHTRGKLALQHGFRMQVQGIRSDLDSSIMTLLSSRCPRSISVCSFFSQSEQVYCSVLIEKIITHGYVRIKYFYILAAGGRSFHFIIVLYLFVDENPAKGRSSSSMSYCFHDGHFIMHARLLKEL